MMGLHVRAWLPISVGLVLACASSTVQAQELGRESNLVFGAERLAGLYLGQRTVDAGAVQLETDYSGLALLWDRPPSPLVGPRLTADFFPSDELSIGGGLGFFVQDVGAGDEDENRRGAILLLRAGYALRLSHSIFLWPRGGLVYYDVDLDLGGGELSQLALEIEAIFSFAPADGWALTVGPGVDLGLTGEDDNQDMSEYSFTLLLGFVGWVEL